MAENPTKRCPFCGERIHAEAIKCRFCREFLEDDNGLPISNHARTFRPGPVAEPPAEDAAAAAAAEPLEDEQILIVRPSLWALAGVFVKALAGIVAAGVLIGYPFESLLAEHLDSIEPAVGYIFSARRWLAAGLMVLMVGWVLYRAVALKRVRYEVCPERIEFARGIFSRHIDNLDIFRIVDIKLHRSLADCLTGVGAVTLFTRDKTDPTFRFEKVKDPKALYDVIKKATLIADRKQGVVHVQ